MRFGLTQVRLPIIRGYKQCGLSRSTCGVCCKVLGYMVLIGEVCGPIARELQ